MNSVSGCGTLSGRRINAFSTLNTMALAPMASASVSTAVKANPGAFRNCRRASLISAFMLPLRYASLVYAWSCILLGFPGLVLVVRTGWGGGSICCCRFLSIGGNWRLMVASVERRRWWGPGGVREQRGG